MMTKYIYFHLTYLHTYDTYTDSSLIAFFIKWSWGWGSWIELKVEIRRGSGSWWRAESEHKYYTLKSETCFNQLTSNVNAESSIKTALSEQRPHARRSVTTSPCNEKTLKIWWNIPDNICVLPSKRRTQSYSNRKCWGTSLPRHSHSPPDVERLLERSALPSPSS